MKFDLRHIIGIAIGIALFFGVVSSLFFDGDSSAAADIPAKNISFSCACCGTIQPDQSLFWALVDRGVPPAIVENVRKPLSSVLDMRKIYPGDRYELDYSNDGSVQRFELIRSPWEKYIVCRNESTLVAQKDSISLTRFVFAAEGTVESTLWESMRKMNIEPEAIMDFTDVLAYDFDFVTDTRNGHRFRIAYEKIEFGDSIVKIGKILLAQYITSEKAHTAIWYEDPSSRTGYFNLAGKSMKKSLLKAPLTYRRISSHFTHKRFHPILKIYRPHLGVDYAAPTGTPVVASGNGKIVYAGKRGGFGNFIHIKHSNGIETTYGHLSRYAKGIHSGVRVKRGQVIGYVGMTGLATGPHLDYRVKVNGKFVNPEKYAFPAEPPVARKYIEKYKKYANSVLDDVKILASVSNRDNFIRTNREYIDSNE